MVFTVMETLYGFITSMGPQYDYITARGPLVWLYNRHRANYGFITGMEVIYGFFTHFVNKGPKISLSGPARFLSFVNCYYALRQVYMLPYKSIKKNA